MKIEDILFSAPFMAVISEIGKIIRWGTVVIEFREGKPVMVRHNHDIKL